MKHIPTVSVIMGTRYVRTDIDLLRRSVESILEQTYSDFEFLICDDGSSSEAQAFLEATMRKDIRVKLVRDSTCLDLARKLNLCLQKAKGQYIARMDDDDYSCPNRFEKQIAYLKEKKNCSFVGCNVNLVCNGKFVKLRRLPEFPTVNDFLITQPYIHPTLIFRREVFNALLGYSEDESCNLCEDYDLLLRAYTHGYTGSNLQECLFSYTVPITAKGTRTMHARWNESVTRYRRFKELGILPKAWPYVLKPILVGLMPEKVLDQVKKHYDGIR